MIVAIIILLNLALIGVWVKGKMKIGWKFFSTVVAFCLTYLLIAPPEAIKKYFPTPKIFIIKDLVRVGNLGYCVENAQFTKELTHGFMHRSSYSGLYLVAIVTVKNLSHEPLNIDNHSFSLTDDEGNKYSISNEASLISEFGAGLSIYGQCNPNIVKGGYVIFEVPEAKTYTIHLSDCEKSGKEKTVRLVEK